MNKFTAALVLVGLVGALIGTASANKKHHPHHLHEQDDFEDHEPDHWGHGGNAHAHGVHGGHKWASGGHDEFDDDFERPHHPHGGQKWGGGGGGFVFPDHNDCGGHGCHPQHQHPPHQGGKFHKKAHKGHPIGWKKRKHLHKHRRPSFEGGAGGAHAGASKHFRGEGAHQGHLGGSSAANIHGFAEGHKTNIHGDHDRVDFGTDSGITKENDGFRKHQVFNKDKTVVKDKQHGVNDEEGFHNSKSINNGVHASKEHDNLDVNHVGGSLGGGAGFEKNFDASHSGSGSIESDSAAEGSAAGGAFSGHF